MTKMFLAILPTSCIKAKLLGKLVSELEHHDILVKQISKTAGLSQTASAKLNPFQPNTSDHAIFQRELTQAPGPCALILELGDGPTLHCQQNILHTIVARGQIVLLEETTAESPRANMIFGYLAEASMLETKLRLDLDNWDAEDGCNPTSENPGCIEIITYSSWGPTLRATLPDSTTKIDINHEFDHGALHQTVYTNTMSDDCPIISIHADHRGFYAESTNGGADSQSILFDDQGAHFKANAPWEPANENVITLVT